MKNKRTQAQRQRIDFNRHANAQTPVHTISDKDATEEDTLRISAALLACYSAGKDA